MADSEAGLNVYTCVRMLYCFLRTKDLNRAPLCYSDLYRVSGAPIMARFEVQDYFIFRGESKHWLIDALQYLPT